MTLNIIDYITQNKKLKQKDIAKKIGVTTGQISKWKQGEYISSERKADLIKLAGLFSDNPLWVNIALNKSNANAWFNYSKEISFLRGINIEALEDTLETSIPSIFVLLSQFGVQIPKKAISADDPDSKEFHYLFATLLKDYCVILNWHKRFFIGLSKDVEIIKIVNAIESESLNIASISLNKKYWKVSGFQNDLFLNHSEETKSRVRKLLHQLLRLMNSNRIPITEDLFLVINESADWLALKISFSNDKDEISNYLPYSDRKNLETRQYETELLESLHQKFNILLEKQVLRTRQKN
jgi:transcriptional regulator with XRE-family HTH domain